MAARGGEAQCRGTGWGIAEALCGVARWEAGTRGSFPIKGTCWMDIHSRISSRLRRPDLHEGTDSSIISGVRSRPRGNLARHAQKCHASISYNFSTLVIRGFVLPRFDSTCQLCIWVWCLFSTTPLHTYFWCVCVCVCELRVMGLLEVSLPKFSGLLFSREF